MEILIGLGLMVAAQICKKWITPKYGATGVHVFIFILALAVTGLQYLATHNPSIMKMLEQAGLLLIASVGTYHVLFEKIGTVMSPNVLSSDQ